MSRNQDLRKETSTPLGQAEVGGTPGRILQCLFPKPCPPAVRNKGEKHPFVSSKIDRNFYSVSGFDPKCTDLNNDKLFAPFSEPCDIFIASFLSDSGKKQKKKKLLVYFSKSVFKEEYEYITFILDSIKKQQDYTALCMSRK